MSPLDSNPAIPPRLLMIGDAAPLFSCRTTAGERTLASYRGRWLVFFSHPADFTPVCTSEFIAFARAHEAFLALNCDLLALSVDSVFSHIAWLASIRQQFDVAVTFPVIEDPSMAIARAYGMIHAESGHSGTVRACFVIDPDGHIRMIFWYPMSVGRNVGEILRAVQALQVSDAHHVLTPENWQPGGDVISHTAFDAPGAADAPNWFFRTQALEAAR